MKDQKSNCILNTKKIIDLKINNMTDFPIN